MSQAIRIIATLVPALVAALTAFSPYLQPYIQSHPELATGLFALYSILAALMPSPIGAKVPKA